MSTAVLLSAGCGALQKGDAVQPQASAAPVEAAPEPLMQSLILLTRYQEMMFVESGHYATGADLKAYIEAQAPEDAGLLDGTVIRISKGGAAYCAAMQSGDTAMVARLDDTLPADATAASWYATVPVPAAGIATLCK
ncbi:hypothetical protein [Deinococcus soli (ex Cha et al. 2016)]|uniref:Uncharacterized protein n=2 Tax=Deinococcus soli (ex Cha et al. 2016) TaxID=1309411 RepID=A0ACC6KFZ6_9DEIO|nr:hypothetical protein [Deinococcus soli (ex Cha et al. 2016)]MDR6218323.1 hypothetical protein [Deinococcus soli (ex Cha et al. 2016)]MDR6329063.1 hypothetical protein [Deinococcus soli (ex Cha et al. 2016)]MDR6751336.1 hypothetical protein [Deinococcus soli (ex Cha et al. 2016)]